MERLKGQYRGRFAPSPTGPLHAGSLVAALASWLDARANHGQWLIRMEDVDAPRCIIGADHIILQQLALCGLRADEPVEYQSQRSAHYQQALDRLLTQGDAYGCNCSRRTIDLAWATQGVQHQRHGERIYPGTCRPLQRTNALAADQAFRVRTVDQQDQPITVEWTDRRLGMQRQSLSTEVGDFVVKRRDGWWAYQLAVVVDDAAQGITHVVRGEDLADNTPRQWHLQTLLHLPSPIYLHTPLVLDSQGEKLSKSSLAPPLQLESDAEVFQALNQAMQALGLSPSTLSSLPAWQEQAINQWAQRWVTT